MSEVRTFGRRRRRAEREQGRWRRKVNQTTQKKKVKNENVKWRSLLLLFIGDAFLLLSFWVVGVVLFFPSMVLLSLGWCCPPSSFVWVVRLFHLFPVGGAAFHILLWSGAVFLLPP